MGRMFGFLSLVVGLAVGMYVYSKQAQSSSAATGATTPKTTISVTGVRTDLMSIAAAERQYYASEGRYTSLDDLISNHFIAVARQRPPYIYDVQTSTGGFRVTATRSGGDDAGLPAEISVDQDMEIKTTQ